MSFRSWIDLEDPENIDETTPLTVLEIAEEGDGERTVGSGVSGEGTTPDNVVSDIVTGAGYVSRENVNTTGDVVPNDNVRTENVFSQKGTTNTDIGNASIVPSDPVVIPDHKFSFILKMDHEEAMEDRGNLHDEVEKMFEAPPTFKIEDFSEGPQNVVADRGKFVEDFPMKDTRRIDEEEFTSHRRDSFPHIHVPLKSIRSRSLKNIPLLPLMLEKKDKTKKKKKDKKKDEKRKEGKKKEDKHDYRRKSYPSKAAPLSPSIPEALVEEETSESASTSETEEQTRLIAPGSVPSIRVTASPDQVGFYMGESGVSHDSEQELNNLSNQVHPSYSDAEADKLLDDADDRPRATFHFGDDESPVPSRKASLKVPTTDENGQRVHFQLGGDLGGSEDNLVWQKKKEGKENVPKSKEGVSHVSSRSEVKGHRHKHKHHHYYYYEGLNKEDLMMRRQKGSEVEVQDVLKRVPTELEEAITLHKADLDEMASHRREDLSGLRRHMIERKKHRTVSSVVSIGKSEKKKWKQLLLRKKYDHSPHEMFVELDELYVGENKDIEWREKARWIKFEEDVEEGAERWGKPHVASLSFHSLLELRRGLEQGALLLDLEATDLSSIVHHVVENMVIHDQIRSEDKANIIRTLLLKHKHVGESLVSLIRRNKSFLNLRGLDEFRHQREELSLMKTLTSSTSFHNSPSSQNVLFYNRSMSEPNDKQTENHLDVKSPSFVKVDMDSSAADGNHKDNTTQETQREIQQQKNFQEIMRRIPHNAEASVVLVGQVDYLAKPAMAFVRLAEGQVLENLTEVPLPVRFLFILLVPEKSKMEYHEVGRSISTLMSNQHFHDVAYKAETRPELLQAINMFLDESIVLPPGDWDQKTLLPIMDMARKRAKVKRRKKEKEEERNALLLKGKKHKVPVDPLIRTKVLFGGLFNDIKRRYPYYLSDFTDALNFQCVMAFIFIFFACLAPCITFGGLMEEKTRGLMGVTETVVGTAITGVVFGLFAGQPLMIVGATGPALVFEKHLLTFCKTSHIEFLPWRIWIGLWVFVITMIVLAAEGSFLVKYITRFTEEIFAVLISMIFIVEVIYKLKEIYEEHPLQFYYCDSCATYQQPDLNITNGSSVVINNVTSYMSNAMKQSVIAAYNVNVTVTGNHDDDNQDDFYSYYEEIVPMQHHYIKQFNQPNTALLSTILVLGTFLIAYFLRIFRNSRFLGRSARRALGDFGIFIAIIAMVLFDYFLADTYTQKLDLPEPFGPTNRRVRGWIINPLGEKYHMETWHIFIAIIPAFLFYLLLFLEVQLTEMLLHKKEMKLKKGSGFHLDQFLMGLMTFILPIFGLPWMCAATVRTVAHVSALSVMSKTHAPGEKPKLIEVKEQRVTNILMNILIGFSLAVEPILRQVPMAVLFGVFLYLGISSISAVQLFRRIRLLFMPVKHHPQVGFVRRVRTSKMHLFTLIQMGLAAVLWVVKSTQAAIAFPLFVFLLVPLRLKILPFMFSKKELNELDKEEEDTDDEDDDEPDFYQRAHMPI